VAAGLRLRVVNTQDNSVLERTFDRSPVRIGRSSLNELQIDAPFVSQYHAVIDFDAKRIELRDLGSTNGTSLRSGRLPPNTPVDLTAHNHEFAIVSLWFQLSPISEVEPVKSERRRRGAVLSMGPQELQKIMMGSSSPALAQAPAGAADPTPELLARLRPAYAEYRAAWARFYRELFGAMNSIDAAARDRLLQQITVEMGPAQGENDFQRLAAHLGRPVAAPAQAPRAAAREETVALQALRDLAASYLPQHGTLERVVDVVAFAQKVQDALDVFFKCFLPLRDGHRQFRTQLDIKRSRSAMDLSVARAVETAREPRELAARVLDWTDASNEGTRAIESTFAEVMVHQVAMLSGVMKGVRSLLSKLAPASIEAELGNPRRRAASGMQIGPFRYKTLWELYAEIYGDFAEDEKQAFMAIFGAEFVNAYSELAGDGAAPAQGANAPQGFHTTSPSPHAGGPFPQTTGAGAGLPWGPTPSQGNNSRR
jgi:type VI secretion system protein ImpI